LRSSTRRLVVATTAALALLLATAACSKKATETGTGTGSTSGGTAPSGASGIDYSKLSGTINGSGATFPKPFYEQAIQGMKGKASNLTINYAGGGSGKGKQDLADQVVDWAGSDSTVKQEDLAKYKGGQILYFPTVAAPITVSYNLSGVDKLQLSPSTLAKIFQGDIKTWNDPAIAADNPGVTLPGTTVVVAHRSDGSGTTSNFTKYLKAAAGADWKLDAGDTVNWPADTQAGNGNAGVAQIVKGTEGAIGYVDYSDAKASSLKFAAIKNKDGQYVAPSIEGASAALDGAQIKDDLTYDPLNAAGAKAYPITAPTWIIVYQKQSDPTKGNAVKGWVNYVLTEGQTVAPQVDYAPLPPGLQQKAVAQLDKVQVG
jgi:phosphate transport system substrate-binding protein